MDCKLIGKTGLTRLRCDPASCLMFAISGMLFAFSFVFYLLSHLIV
jgi:hypothetical protein